MTMTIDNLTTVGAFDHERVAISTGRRSGLTITVAVHNTKLGPAIGGCRVWAYPTWQDAVDDALRLSRGMTYKNALAGLPAGGGKSVIALPLGTTLDGELRRAAFLDLGEAVQAMGGQYSTAEDVGSTSADMAVIAEVTSHVVGLPTEHGGKGDPAAFTARGVYASLRETLRRVTGTADPRGRRVSIVGLGQVGSRLATQLAAEGALLTLSDIDEGKRPFATALSAAWVDPAEAHLVRSDIFMPAGVGGMLSARVIAELDTLAVVGPANNQLAHADGAEQLAARGILYAPDYLVNAGGVIFLGSDETEAAILSRIDEIGSTLSDIFDAAARTGSTTVAAADRIVHERLGR